MEFSNGDLTRPLKYLSVKELPKLVTDFLEEKNTDVQATDEHGNTALILAASFGLDDVAASILDKDPSVLEHRNYQGQTAFSLACIHGFTKVCKILIEKGADVDVRGLQSMETPLMIAIRNQDVDLVNLILEKDRSTLERRNRFEQTALLIACTLESDNVVAALINKGANTAVVGSYGEAPLSNAIEMGYTQTVHLLLEKDTSTVEWKTRLGETPLIRAVRNGYCEIAKLLLEKGASCDASDNGGTTPLMYACWVGLRSTARLMLRNQLSSLNKTDSHGRSALDYLFLSYLSDFPTFRMDLHESYYSKIDEEMYATCLAFLRAGAAFHQDPLLQLQSKFYGNKKSMPILPLIILLRQKSSIDFSDQKNNVSMQVQEVAERLLNEIFPISLQVICRMAILRHLPTFGIMGRQFVIASLNLPAVLERFLNFDDFDCFMPPVAT